MRLALAICLLASPALADLRDDMLSRGGPGEVCYERVYDKAHMAKNPGQMVGEIALRPDEAAWNDHLFGVDLRLTLRDGTRLQGHANCPMISGSRMECEMFDTEGAFTLERPKQGDLRLTIRKALWWAGPNEEMYSIGNFAVDQVYRIPAAKAKRCAF